MSTRRKRPGNNSLWLAWVAKGRLLEEGKELEVRDMSRGSSSDRGEGGRASRESLKAGWFEVGGSGELASSQSLLVM